MVALYWSQCPVVERGPGKRNGAWAWIVRDADAGFGRVLKPGMSLSPSSFPPVTTV